MKQQLTVRTEESAKSLIKRARSKLNDFSLNNFNSDLGLIDNDDRKQVLGLLTNFFELVFK